MVNYKRVSITLPLDLVGRTSSFIDNNEFGYKDVSSLVHRSLELYMDYLEGKVTNVAPETILLTVMIGKGHYEILKKYCDDGGLGLNDFITECITLTKEEDKELLERYLQKLINEKMPNLEIELKEISEK